MDSGIKERDFWDMTLAEVKREIESKIRVKKVEEQEKASFDYILADLIGRSIARSFSASNKFPEIYEIYPTLFDSQQLQEKKQEAKADISALRFMQFAQAYNKKFKEVQKQ